jgi:RNA polymerase sigma-70 factor (ECF subfamily)
MSRPTPEELLNEAPTIRRWLARHGVPEVDLDDMTAEVIARAWASIAKGCFKPDPILAPRTALQMWIWAVTWRQSSTFLNRAYRRHELLLEDVPDNSAVTTEGEIIARSDLALLDGIEPERRAVLIAHAAGLQMHEIAAAMGTPVATGWSRLRLARVDLLAILKRRAARER